MEKFFLPPTNDAHVVYSKAESVCVLSCGDGFAIPLPSHPTATGAFRPILTADVAAHVLTRLEPPMGTVESDVYVARGYSREGEAPIVTAVWFKVDITHPVVNLRHVLSRIRGRAIMSSSMCGAHGGDNPGAVQSASGIYIESGIGILAGTGRSSILVGGHPRSLPYYRQTLSENEDLLAELMQKKLAPTSRSIRSGTDTGLSRRGSVAFSSYESPGRGLFFS